MIYIVRVPGNGLYPSYETQYEVDFISWDSILGYFPHEEDLPELLKKQAY